MIINDTVNEYIIEMKRLKDLEKIFREKIEYQKEQAKKKLKDINVSWVDVDKAVQELQIEKVKATRKAKWKESISDSLRNKKYIHFLDINQIYIKKEKVQQYLDQGWELGKIRNKKI